jgi:hypothetical protein
MYVVGGLDSLASVVEHTLRDRNGHTCSRESRATGSAEVMCRKRGYTVPFKPLEASRDAPRNVFRVDRPGAIRIRKKIAAADATAFSFRSS